MAEWVFDAVCVGAHPDDVEIGMGATCAKLASEGKRVAIVDLTNGEPTPFGSAEKRAAEACAAAKVLGVEDRRTLSMQNRYLFDSIEGRTELAAVLRELKPRMLFVPYPTDAHPDHVAASQIASAARFYSKFTKTEMPGEAFYPPKLFHYVAVHMRLLAPPSFIVECGSHLDAKLEALRAYPSQFAENPANAGLIDAVGAAARTWGAFAGVGAGEPFFSAEPIGIASPDEIL